MHPEVLNCYIDVLKLRSKAESELRRGMESLKPEEAAAHALLPFRLAKEGRVREGSGQHDYSGVDVEQNYPPCFEKLLALSLIAFIAILGPFHPMISSFLSSSSSVAMKNFSSSC